jgi:hypothetical protein
MNRPDQSLVATPTSASGSFPSPVGGISHIVRKKRKRLYGKAYDQAIGFLSIIQGNKCKYAGKYERCRGKIEHIHHPNGDPGDTHPENEEGVCGPCNTWLYNLAKAQAKTGGAKQEESEKKFEPEAFDVDDTTSIGLNQKNEPAYRRWLRIRTEPGKSPLYQQEAIYGGAEIVSCSPQASREYLKKAVSPQGMYDSVPVIVAKKQLRQIVPKLTAEWAKTAEEWERAVGDSGR